MVARWIPNPEVMGSIPLLLTCFVAPNQAGSRNEIILHLTFFVRRQSDDAHSNVSRHDIGRLNVHFCCVLTLSEYFLAPSWSRIRRVVFHTRGELERKPSFKTDGRPLLACWHTLRRRAIATALHDPPWNRPALCLVPA